MIHINVCHLREDETVVRGPNLDQVSSVKHKSRPHVVLKPLGEPEEDPSQVAVLHVGLVGFGEKFNVDLDIF